MNIGIDVSENNGTVGAKKTLVAVKGHGQRVIDAVKRFQKEHHQGVDGIVGPHTAPQLAVTLRQHEQHTQQA